MAKKMQTVVFNMDIEDLNALQAFSIIDGRSLGKLICEAIGKYVKDRCRNPNVKERVKKQIESTRKRQENLHKALLTPRRDK